MIETIARAIEACAYLVQLVQRYQFWVCNSYSIVFLVFYFDAISISCLRFDRFYFVYYVRTAVLYTNNIRQIRRIQQ